MVASSLGACAADDSAAKEALSTAAIEIDRPGSDRYQQNHMALIFRDGLSFSGFERNKVFLGRADGGYRDLSAISGADSDGDCRATLVADFDDDGDPDLFVNAVQREAHHLYRNDVGDRGPGGFVKVRLEPSSNAHPDAVGAIVRSRPVGTGTSVQSQVLAFGSGFESQNAPELIFGLGGAGKTRLSVLWPGRQEEDFGAVDRNGRYVLVEGTGKPRPYAARSFRFGDPPVRGVRIRPGEVLGPLVLRNVDKNVDGAREPKQLETTGSKPLLLNFWATTCASCVRELPFLSRVHAGGKFRVVGVSLDRLDSGAKIQKLWQRLKISYPTFLIDEKTAERLFDLQRLAIPVTIIVEASGRVRRIHQGQFREGDL